MIAYRSDPPRTADLVIVGGGVVGAATAFHASRGGFRPVVLERRPALCTLTTAAAAGGFRLQLDSQEDVRLVSESVDLFVDFAGATGQRDYDPHVRQQGYLWLTTTDEGAERQRRIVEAQRSWGLDDIELLDGDDVRREFPFVGGDVLQGRLRRGDGLIDPKGLTFGLAAGSRATFVTGCEAIALRVDRGRLTGVETSLGLVATDTAVIAAGPFSGLVASLAGVDLPISTIRRQKVVLPDVPDVPSHAPMTIDDDTGAHWRPALQGAYLLFTDPATPPSPPVEDVPVEHAFAFRLLDPDSPQAVARVSPFWRSVWDRGAFPLMLQAGHYTMTPDRRPLLGPTHVEGLFVNTGYSGKGVMAGPAGSRLLVDVVTAKIVADDNPFRLDRSFEARPHLDVL